ncbi:hypothetical protein GGI20_003282, partial [Coemansia sp. BCRC 34301]
YLAHGRQTGPPGVVGFGTTSSFPATGASMHAGPTPVATASTHNAPVVEVWEDPHHGPGAGKPKTFTTRAIYTEPTFQYTFWRADITLPLPQETEIDVLYQVYWAADEAAIQSHSARPTFSFRVPAQASQWRMCVTSNAQFERRVPESARAALRGSGPVFRDLLAKHRVNPFHVWVGTGGQFSGDGVWDDCEPALRPFLGADPVRRPNVQWTGDMAAAVERWYFLEYLRQWFGVGASSPTEHEAQALFTQAVAAMPYSFTPDGEIFSGYGSFTPALHFSPVFNGIRHVGAKYFALFQAHTTPTLAHNNEHGFLGEGYHSIKKLGPYTALLTLDTRTERQPAGIIDRHAYDLLFAELEARVPPTASNLVVVASNPVIFPRTKNFEALLRSASSSGLTTIISYAVQGGKPTGRNDWVSKDRFGESVAVTNLNDFWTSALHKSERLFLVRSLQEFARRRSCRITFASGHVNCLSAAHFRTYTDSKFDPRKYPEQRGFVSDYRSMIQLTVSGLVQEPADSLTLRAYHFAGKSAPFDTMTEEKLYHTFNVDVNGLPPPNNNQKLLGRRSYGIIIEHDFDNDRQRPGLLSFFYVENEACTGTATPYIINIPPLRYPQLPQQAGGGALPVEVRPQMRPGVTYRSYVGPSAATTGAGASDPVRHQEEEEEEEYGKQGVTDPYSYELPEYDNPNKVPSPNPKAGGGYAPAAGSPPPYTIASQDVQGHQVLPPRTDGTYSSSYEHTAAWVQGSASHTTGSESGAAGPSHVAAVAGSQPQYYQSQVQQQLPPPQAVVSQQQQQQQQQHHHQAPMSLAPASLASVSQAQYQAPMSQAPYHAPPQQYQQTPPQQYQQSPPPPQQQHGPY